MVTVHELHRRSAGRLRACAVDPGGVVTGIWRHGIFAKGLPALLMKCIFATPEEGCQAVVHAATADWPDGMLDPCGCGSQDTRAVAADAPSSQQLLHDRNSSTSGAVRLRNKADAQRKQAAVGHEVESFESSRAHDSAKTASSARAQQHLCCPLFARGLFARPPVTWVGSSAWHALGPMQTLLLPLAMLNPVLDQPLRSLLHGRFGTAATCAVPKNVRACDQQVGDALWRESCRLCGIGPDMHLGDTR